MIAVADKGGQRSEIGGQRSVQPALALDCMRAHKLFPGRTSLYVHEVADALQCSVRHVIDLIHEGLFIAIAITGVGNKNSADHWRVPVGEFDAYIERRRSDRKTS